MKDKLTVSILGAGNIAGGFDEKKTKSSTGVFSHAGAYTTNGNFILKNIFDIDKNHSKKFQMYWGVENIAKNEDKIINNYQDIISICTPDRFHFDTIKKIIKNKSCKTIFVEKPLGISLEEVKEIYELSQINDINIIVNFQRHFDDTYGIFNSILDDVLTVNCYYIKGINHIGITMIDTLIMLFGYPKEVLTYNKVFNKEIKDDTYEFIFFYNKFNITVKTIDKDVYNYHIFDIDILTKKERLVITDNGNTIVKYDISDYAYSGVNVLSHKPNKQNTNYNISMLECIDYLYQITKYDNQHTINTVVISYNNHILLSKIIESYSKNKKITLEENLWIK